MNTTLLSTSGTFPSVTWDAIRNQWVSVWQDGAVLVSNAGHTINIGGGQTSFPRLDFQDKVLLAYRDGAPPFDGHLASLDSVVHQIRNLKPVHGMFPIVLGNEYVAYQRDDAHAGYPVRRERIFSSDGADVRAGAPTGLAFIDIMGAVRTWDEIPVTDGLHNVTYAGFLHCGATDRGGVPCVVVRDTSGRELVLWQGEDSQNPTIAWDGADGYAVVAWSSAGQGVRMNTFIDAELVYPDAREPVIVTPKNPRFFGWFFEDGRYGEHDELSNVAVQGRGLYKNGANQLPPNVNDLVIASIKQDGGGFIGKGDVRLVKPIWNLIFGMWLHEVGDAATVRWAATDARAEMSREGVKARPIVAVITPGQSLDSSFAKSCDILAPEIYFDEPAGNWDEMYIEAKARVLEVLDALAPTPLILVPQAYDRSDARWKASADQLTAIAQACFSVLDHPRVLGLWPFAYSRPGGATTYPELLKWYRAQANVMQRPPYFNDGGEPVNETYYPNDAQMTNTMQRIADAYVSVLKRVPPASEQPPQGDGIFRVPPDGLEVAIPDHTRENTRIDTKSIAVWTGRYFSYFQKYKGDHEKAINNVLNDIRWSPEGVAANPQ